MQRGVGDVDSSTIFKAFYGAFISLTSDMLLVHLNLDITRFAINTNSDITRMSIGPQFPPNLRFFISLEGKYVFQTC